MPKRVRIESGNRVHFITFSVYKHIPVFKNAVFVKEFLKDLQFYVNDEGTLKRIAFDEI